VQSSAARRRPVALRAIGGAIRLCLAALFVFGAIVALQGAIAEGDTRTLSFHHVHTGEDVTITYKRDGRYVPAALTKLDWFMRDWRKERETHMDPRLFDLLWEVNREVGGREPIQVICGYRSPGTNAMLRARTTGVAQFSQHINGQAVDFYIPGVPLKKVMEVGLRLQDGGVGFYPTSGSPFVHLDTGTVRHWPAVARSELEKAFPDGRTVHIPADGRPLRGYKLALEDVERHGNVPSPHSLEAAREAGAITASEEQIALEAPKHPTLLARLFGRGGNGNAPSPAAAKPRRIVVASLSLPKPRPRVVTWIVPLPEMQPHIALAARPTREETFYTASLGGDEHGAVVKGLALPAPFKVASVAPPALAYADEPTMPPLARVRPMGANLPRLPREAALMRGASGGSIATAAALSGGDANYDSPWLRAAELTPSVRYDMTATKFGSYDPRGFSPLLQKPSTAVLMSFSADPHYGMVADRFTGRAVVFLATANFTAPQTLSMR
jgi:uncharacterized protein YcbK (DUF882 family)